MRFRSPLLALGLLTFAVSPAAVSGCGDNIELAISPTTTGAGGNGGGDTSSGGSSGTFVGSGGAGGQGGGQGGSASPCVPACGGGLHCEVSDSGAACVPDCVLNTDCAPTEKCEPFPDSQGAHCVPNICVTDADCALPDYCNGTICVTDVCVAGVRKCAGQDLIECVTNGSAVEVKFKCGSQSYFTSTCIDKGDGDAYCGCEDDWDCPADTVCNVDQCSGSGKAPTCTIAPVPFAQALPTNEILWGGTGTANKNAVGSPFKTSSQSSLTPVVANLTDDNGDGRINELDFPEIVFVTYCLQEITTNGIVRAIHGGGPNKGKDFFATAGANVWHEGDNIDKAYTCGEGTANSTGAIAVGDLDNDGIPEIVVPTESFGLQILSNTGVPIAATAANQWPVAFANPSVALANLDNQGFAEIVVGHMVFTLEHDVAGKLKFVDKFAGNLSSGKQGEGPVSCIANIAGDSRQEIVAGTTAYAFPAPPGGVKKIADCPIGAMDDFCLGKLTVVWDGQTVNGVAMLPDTQREGFCAVADVLGANEMNPPGPANPLDGKAEVVLINNGFLTILNGENGSLRRFTNLNSGIDGGAPNIDDFDGDGFPEIGTALASAYFMIDLQAPSAACPAWPTNFDDALGPGLQGNPARSPGAACTMDSECAAGAVCNKIVGSCVCLHNGWGRVTEDDSSRTTASSVFDFNGDGAAEVIYNDECFFRVYDGTNAGILFKHDNPSRTRIENPVVADVDNDGNAEIVFVANNEATFCSSDNVDFPNGIQVWGDKNDAWVSARRIWNQHAYHVTNVLESGGIPIKEPESWRPYQSRIYNTYRSNPRAYGIAPDLAIPSVQIANPDKGCGVLSTKIDINVQIANLGDLRVGPGVILTFYGEWTNPALKEPLYADAAKTKLTTTIQNSIEPGDSILLTVSYLASNNAPGTLPDMVRVVVDEPTDPLVPTGKERECNEFNNEKTSPVNAGTNQADLRIALGALGQCPNPMVTTTIFNDGSASASNITVRFYAGDPSQGGQVLYTAIVPGPIAAGGSETFVAAIPNFPAEKAILIYAVVDPENAILECNDANNKDPADKELFCTVG